jgi:hypothetical protein
MRASSRLKPVSLVDRGHPVGLVVGRTTETRAFDPTGGSQASNKGDCGLGPAKTINATAT